MTDVERAPPNAIVFLFALGTGALAANLYYAQPLIASISASLAIDLHLAGSIVSVMQIGYGIGLFFFVSLADLVENRRLVLATLGVTTIGLLGAGLSQTAAPFFACCLLIGLTSTGAQVLVPFMARLAPPAMRGRLVGTVMSGLLTGVMLARPVALFIAATFGWRAVFFASAILMLLIGTALAATMPRYQPRSDKTYGAILASTPGLWRDLPYLRRRAIYQALLFAAFQVFWTVAPLVLADRFGLSQRGIGLFALAGAGGALVAPLAGRLSDRGLVGPLTVVATAGSALFFWATIPVVAAGGLVLFVILAILLDGATQINHIASQRVIFAAPAEVRGRVNALYVVCSFTGGAIGSFASTALYQHGGWAAAAIPGGCAGFLALLLYGFEVLVTRRQR
jgi:predicted MFS family arabinose efflux permease